jgi:uncharacterized protein (TIGR02145 family)
MQLFKKKAYTIISEECFNCIPHNVTIGDQVWTGCNLSVTTYRNGNTIPQVTDPIAWEALTTGAWCHVNGDPANEPIYGRLYNWYAVTDPRGLGPVGYHVPTVAERDALASYLGGLSVAGGKMKEIGTCHWQYPNVDATDESGFTAFGAGDRSYDGTYENFKFSGAWWTSTTAGFNPLFASNFSVAASIPNFMGPSTFAEKTRGYSVRLIQDVVSTPIDFILTKTCSGSSLTQIILDDITGGTGPYYPATDTFADESAALANTTWSTTPNSGSTAVYYPETVAGTYWVAVKHSVGDIFAKEIFADCWDSLTANREQGYISLSGTTNGTTACGYPIPSVDGIYVATHVLNTLSIGDRVFLSDLPSITPFDGSTGIPPAYLSQYWKINLQTEVSPCTGNGTRVLIDKDGYIEELYCCPSTGE